MKTSRVTLSQLWPFALIAFVLFVAHYGQFLRFGYYGDDFPLIASGVNRDLKSTGEFLLGSFSSWPEGRPLGFAFCALMGPLGRVLFGKVWGEYVISFLIVFWVSASVYVFCVRTWTDRRLGIFSALLFLLWPADTNLARLCHVCQPIAALGFFIWFAILYSEKKLALSLASLFLAMLTYESLLTAAWCIPVFFYFRERNFAPNGRLRPLLHLTLVLATCGVYVFLRWRLREHRLEELQLTSLAFGDMAVKMTRSLWLGPLAALSAPFFFHPLDWTIQRIGVAAFCSLLFFGVLIACPRKPRKSEEGWRQPFSAAAFGGLLMVFSYPLFSFMPYRYPPTELVGTQNSIHGSALFGLSIFLAGCISFVLDRIQEHRAARTVIVLLVAMGIGSLTRLGIDVQEGFASAWSIEKTRIRETITSLPVLEDGSVVFLKGDLPRSSPHIQHYSHFEPDLLAKLFEFPSSWKSAPRVFAMSFEEWPDQIVKTLPSGDVEWVPPALYTGHVNSYFPEKKVSFLRVRGWGVEREEGDQRPHFGEMGLKKKPLYSFLDLETAP